MNSESKKRLLILKAKNVGKRYKSTYTRELTQLVIPDIDETRFLPLEKTLELPPIEGDKKKYRFPFEKKETLCTIIKELIKEKDGEILLITYYSKLCGAYILDSLKDFNIYFDFEAEHSGLIVLRLADSSNKLLLDFYEENGERLLDVEIFGDKWSK